MLTDDPRIPKSRKAPTPGFPISSVPISSIQGDLRRAVAVGPRHRNGITTQATETRLHDRLLTIVNSDGSGVNDRNQDANPLNGFSLIFRERYAYLEEVIR